MPTEAKPRPKSEPDTTPSPDSPPDAPDGAGNALLSLIGEGAGLRYQGLVVAAEEPRSGVSREGNRPWARQTFKCTDGKTTIGLNQRADTIDQLPPALPIGSVVEVLVTSVQQANFGEITIGGDISIV